MPGDACHSESLEMLSHVGPTERTAVGFLDRIATLTGTNRLALHRVTAVQEAKAQQWLRRHDERKYSFVDATSFEVMLQRRLRAALAFDHDFSAAGFVEVRP